MEHDENVDVTVDDDCTAVEYTASCAIDLSEDETDTEETVDGELEIEATD